MQEGDEMAKVQQINLDEELPEWLRPVDPTPQYGRKAGSGPTQQMVLKVFETALKHGVTALQPHQVHGGAVELFGYRASREVIKECMKKLVRIGLLATDADGLYRKGDR